MLIEKYVTIPVDIEVDKYGSTDTYWEEVYVPDAEIRHYIDEILSAEDVINYAKQIDPDYFEENPGDLDVAYNILINQFDEHSDIPDFYNLQDWIEDSIKEDYKHEARQLAWDSIEDEKDRRIMWDTYGR